MKEIREILKQVEELTGDNRAVLATVVDLKGSGYRLPGARMLIKANGDAVGTVSGGCLEADVMERAKRVLASGRAELFTYDTTVEENSVFSLNMGCRGVMRILLEAVDGDSEIIRVLRRVWATRVPVASAVLIGGNDQAIGGRIFLNDGSAEAAADPHGLCGPVPTLCEDLFTFFGSMTPYETIRYETEIGFSEFVFETLRPPIKLAVFGAGADAVPLAETAWSLGWQVDVYDHRPAFINRDRFTSADEIILTGRSDVPAIAADSMTAIVVMNHNYDRDKAILPVALRTDAFYVGALGPKKRTQQMLDEIKDAGETFEIEQLSRMRSPAGLDIGGDSPETIAISIIAEIQSVLKKRTGGPLKDRVAPIYDRR